MGVHTAPDGAKYMITEFLVNGSLDVLLQKQPEDFSFSKLINMYVYLFPTLDLHIEIGLKRQPVGFNIYMKIRSFIGIYHAEIFW